MNTRINTIIPIMLGALLCSAAAGAADVKDAIVKIYTSHNIPDYQNPWSMRGTFQSTGSGCVIKGRRILTNAHIVSDQTFIQVRRNGSARRYKARVLNVAHTADLALLTVDDPAFFENIEPLELGDLPQAQQEVLVYGFPLGGDTLSITKGVVSRVEHQTYAHSSAYLLAVQIDAAINPGNSGGPALVSNRIVGVAMQGISQADNIGYIVPAPIIAHFLEDIADGQWDGIPSLGVALTEMRNPDLRRMYQMPTNATGALVIRTVRGSPADGVLREGDAILRIAGHPVADDGTVEFRPRERTSLAYYIQERQIGDYLNLDILRDGAVQPLRVQLNRPLEKDCLVPNERYDVLPTYYIFGGLVFCPLTKNLLESWGPNWADAAPESLVALLQFNYITDERDEVVVLLKVLAADINEGYDDYFAWIVSEVNGRRIRHLRDLIAAVADTNAGPYVVFQDKFGDRIVLDRAKATASAAPLMETYRIKRDRSPDLTEE